MFRYLLLLFCLAAFVDANAQSPKKYIQSPLITHDSIVTFSFLAPNAEKVLLIMDDGKPRPMSKDTTGVWHYTETLAPDIYRYTFSIDGNVLPDPNNPDIKPLFKRALGQSLVQVHGPPDSSWEQNDVPHGILSQHFFRSAIIGDDRDIRVYTPPGYDAARKEPYPVLYLFHGLTDETRAWVTAGRENIIMDNLIAQQKVTPMIIVNTLGYGAPEMLDPSNTQGIDSYKEKNEKLFIESLLKEVIPMVDKLYNTGKAKQYRAVAGLSMGGGQALDAGLNHPDVFDYMGAFSPAVVLLNPDYRKAFPKLDNTINNQLKLVWIAIGKDDFLLESVRKYKDWLKELNIRFDYKETDGVHSYQVWRRYLTEFAPLLFK